MVEKIKQALERAFEERIQTTSDAGRSPQPRQRPHLGGSQKNSTPDFLANATRVEINTRNLPKNRVIALDDSDSAIESYRLLRTQLINMSEHDELHAIGITSPNANAGKTLTSVNLAISMARTADSRVILVDADIANPSIAALFGMTSEYGLVDYLRGDITLEKIVLQLNIPNLWVVPGRYNHQSMLDQAGTGRIEELLNVVTGGGRNIVIADLPPVLAKDDTLAMASRLDGVILVVEEGTTKTAEVTRSAALLKKSNLIGTVLNKFRRQQATYY